jgi:alpha-1,3-rhamnosyl/mannosyltransferase
MPELDKLRVGLGTTVLCRGLRGAGVDGIGNYTKELLGRLSANPALDVVPFSFGHGGAACDGLGAMRLPRFSLGSLPSLIADQSYAGIGKLRPVVDVIHATDHLIPRVKGVPVLATLMDAIPLAQPQWVNNRFRTLKNLVWKRTAHFADHVVTISEYSKADLIHYFDLPEEKISVAPLGVDERWFIQPADSQLESIRTRFGLPENFFVFIGTFQPRKNIERVIDAHRALAANLRQSHPLILIGREGVQCAGVMQRLACTDPLVRWLQYVPDADLPTILRCSSGLVFPSLYEGFGLPVLEAFAAEVPVITSNVSSLPEVAGDAALLVNPHDYENICWAMQQLIEKPELVQNLIDAGLKRAFRFTWDQTAKSTIEIYRHLGARH